MTRQIQAWTNLVHLGVEPRSLAKWVNVLTNTKSPIIFVLHAGKLFEPNLKAHLFSIYFCFLNKFHLDRPVFNCISWTMSYGVTLGCLPKLDQSILTVSIFSKAACRIHNFMQTMSVCLPRWLRSDYTTQLMWDTTRSICTWIVYYIMFLFFRSLPIS